MGNEALFVEWNGMGEREKQRQFWGGKELGGEN